jgi:hypothetical protein
LTRYPKFEGSNPASAGNERDQMVENKKVENEMVENEMVEQIFAEFLFDKNTSI